MLVSHTHAPYARGAKPLRGARTGLEPLLALVGREVQDVEARRRLATGGALTFPAPRRPARGIAEVGAGTGTAVLVHPFVGVHRPKW